MAASTTYRAINPIAAKATAQHERRHDGLIFHASRASIVNWPLTGIRPRSLPRAMHSSIPMGADLVHPHHLARHRVRRQPPLDMIQQGYALVATLADDKILTQFVCPSSLRSSVAIGAGGSDVCPAGAEAGLPGGLWVWDTSGSDDFGMGVAFVRWAFAQRRTFR